MEKRLSNDREKMIRQTVTFENDTGESVTVVIAGDEDGYTIVRFTPAYTEKNMSKYKVAMEFVTFLNRKKGGS